MKCFCILLFQLEWFKITEEHSIEHNPGELAFNWFHIETKLSNLHYIITSVPSVNLDMLNISHAKKAQDLATETKYRTFLHEYTTLPTDMNVAWAKKAYGLQSDVSLTDIT